MEEEKRYKIITEYVMNHQGCKAEDVITGVDTEISRVPAYNTINSLIKEGILLDVRKNRRDHRLVVNADNLLVVIPSELEHFKDYFFPVLDKVEDLIQRESLNENQKEDLLWYILGILSYLMNVYNYRAILIWPRKTKDPDILNKLYLLVYSRITEILIRSFNSLQSALHLSDTDELISHIPFHGFNAFDSKFISSRLLEKFIDLGIENEARPLVNYLVKVDAELGLPPDGKLPDLVSRKNKNPIINESSGFS